MDVLPSRLQQYVFWKEIFIIYKFLFRQGYVRHLLLFSSVI